MDARPVLLVVLLALAGCVAPPEAEEAPPVDAAAGPAAPLAPQTGALLVTARMPDLQPLPGVAVTVGNRSATTDGEGKARLDGLAPGRHTVEARKEAHRTALLDVEVEANATREVEVVLAPLGNDQHAHEKGIFAHKDHYVFEGHFDCSLTYVIISGDCLVVLENVTGRELGVTKERHLIDFPLDATWRTLVVELTWTAELDTPATGRGMTLSLEPSEAPADGHAARYARAAGEAPLRLELQAGERHASASAQDMPNPDGGEVIRARAYVMGAGHDAGGLGFLGVSAATKHEFQLHVSIFYGERAPEAYSALAGSDA